MESKPDIIQSRQFFTNEIKAPEANEMLERTPDWFLRWGVLSVALILALLLTLSMVISYPDITESEAVMTSIPEPASIRSPSAGRIARLFTKDNSIVAEGAPIAEIESRKNKQALLISAPFSGEVQYTLPLNINDQVVPDEPLFVISPAQCKYWAIISLPASKLSKIKIGQKVQLEADGYPYTDYGFIEGRVYKICKFNQGTQHPTPPNETPQASCLVYISLPAEIKTNYDKAINITSGTAARAKVITEDISIFNRMRKHLTKWHAQ